MITLNTIIAALIPITQTQNNQISLTPNGMAAFLIAYTLFLLPFWGYYLIYIIKCKWQKVNKWKIKRPNDVLVLFTIMYCVLWLIIIFAIVVAYIDFLFFK